jgi:L-aspartate oxidase
MTSAKAQHTDFLVLGSSIAGLRAAIALAERGRVVILTKGDVGDPTTRSAHSRVPVTLGEDEEVSLHLHDTLRAGEGLCREEAVRVLLEETPARTEELIHWESRSEHNGSRLAFKHENSHGHSRLLHAHGDSTGAEMLRVLAAKVRSLDKVRVLPHCFATGLVMDGTRAAGVTHLEGGAQKELRAEAVLLATGGLGQAYQDTTNPAIASGDGVAMAWRAGALLSDMEFVHFCPTALYVKGAPRILLATALLDEGAKLRNIDLQRFMPEHHEAAELAPQDVLTRAAFLEMQRTKSDFIYLDLTSLDEARLKKRFPKIYSTCMEYNIDIATDLLPVRPAAHFAMGGVATDLDGATTLDGLFAAGEVAATGVHGANRLPGNTLLEGLVFGARAAAAMMAGKRAGHKPAGKASRPPIGTTHSAGPNGAPAISKADIERMATDIRCLMWKKVGIMREGRELSAAVARLDSLVIAASGLNQAEYETQNILDISKAVARSALARQESRGAHYRSDYPLRDEAAPPRHSFLCGNQPVYFE